MQQQTKRNVLKWTLIALVCILLLAVAAISAAALAARQFRDSQKIAPNVTVQGVPVGDLGPAEATDAVLRRWASKLPDRIALRWAVGQVLASPEQLGARIRIKPAIARAQRIGREGGLVAQTLTRYKLRRSGVDIPVDVEVVEAEIETYIIELVDLVNRKPRNADIDVIGARVKVVPGELGVELDVSASTQALVAALKDPEIRAFDLTVKTQPPAIRSEDLQHLQVVLASYTTKFRAWQRDRTHNLKMAITNLGRTVVMPGQSFSFNERVGPRLSERGWRAAPIFINGEVEPSTGGGICQVATTVYNAVLLANLEATERHHHSRPVDYVPTGRDATVYWGQLDLQFVNNLQHPILLYGEIDDKQLTIKILGHRDDKYDVDILSSGVGTIAFKTEETPDPELELDKREVEKPGRNGKIVTITRVAKKSGIEVSRERLHRDVYSPQTEQIRIGAKLPEDALEGAEGLAPGTVPPATTGPDTLAPTTGEAPSAPSRASSIQRTPRDPHSAPATPKPTPPAADPDPTD